MCAAGKLDELRAGDRSGERLAVRLRRGEVVRADDDERRRANAGHGGGLVHVADRRAAADVAARIGVDERGACTRQPRRFLRQEGLGEPARQDGVRDRRSAALVHRIDARGPDIGRKLRRRVRKHQLVDPVERIRAEPLPDHPADGDSCEAEPRDTGGIRDRQRVAPKGLDRVIARRCVGRPVPTHVETDHMEALDELRQDRIPQRHVGAKRVAEQQARASAHRHRCATRGARRRG